MGLRVVFFGDGPWATDSLRRLLADGHVIPGVVLRPRPSDPGLARAAGEYDIPVLQPANPNDPAFVASVRALEPDVNASVSYDQILRAPILASAPLGFLNFHAGKLPHYRGRNIINWAILNGEREIGMTGHRMDDGIDTGDILLQRTLPLGPDETYGDVLAKVVAAFPALVADTLRLVERGEARPAAQRHLPGTYFPARGEGDEWIDWSRTSREIHDLVRAISRPGPGARTLLDGRPVTIWRTVHDPAAPRYFATPGHVVGRSPGGALVKTGDSTLLIAEAETPPEAPGAPRWRVGTRLGINLMSHLRALEARLAALEARIR